MNTTDLFYYFLFAKSRVNENGIARLDGIVSPLILKGQFIHHICSLLTIHYTDSLLMLAFLRDANTSQSVIDVFDRFYWELDPATFRRLFPVLLCDNGSEFSNPSAIEFDKEGNRRTYIFYCDPSAPYQKGAAENNHEFIRRIIPKGTGFDDFTQADINLMMSHINSHGRKKPNDRSPYSVFSFLHGNDLLKL